MEIEIVCYWVAVAFVAGFFLGALVKGDLTRRERNRVYAKGHDDGRYQTAIAREGPLPYPHKPPSLEYSPMAEYDRTIIGGRE